MTLVTKQTIAGVLVFNTAARRTSARNVISNYLNRPRVNVLPSSPALTDENTGKYGVGFGLIVRADWVNIADANEAWADFRANIAGLLANGSFVDQYTSNEDLETGLNEGIYVHRLHVPAQSNDF